MYMKKIYIFLFLLPLFFFPLVSSAQQRIQPDSAVSFEGSGTSLDVGVSGYTDSLWVECAGVSNLCSTLISSTGPYTILSIGQIYSGARATLTCGDTQVFPSQFFDYIDNLSTVSSSLVSNIQIHCNSDLVSSSDSPNYFFIQYVPYDTRVENPTPGDKISYYDWLLVEGFIVFALALIILQPIIKAFFPRK